MLLQLSQVYMTCLYSITLPWLEHGATPTHVQQHVQGGSACLWPLSNVVALYYIGYVLHIIMLDCLGKGTHVHVCTCM